MKLAKITILVGFLFYLCFYYSALSEFVVNFNSFLPIMIFSLDLYYFFFCFAFFVCAVFSSLYLSWVNISNIQTTTFVRSLVQLFPFHFSMFIYNLFFSSFFRFFFSHLLFILFLFVSIAWFNLEVFVRFCFWKRLLPPASLVRLSRNGLMMTTTPSEWWQWWWLL